MDRDRTKDSYNLPITKAVSKAVSIPVVASGGAGNPQHMVDAILMAQADAVLAASIFHFGQYTIAQTKNLMAANAIPVRLG
jgi:cyclase